MTQGDLEKLPGGVGRLMKDLENRIMEDIVRRIRQNCFSTATADWQITRLAQLGESEQYIQEYVMQALQATEKELDEIFSDETYREYMGASRGYKVFGQEQIPFAENRKLQSLISSVKTQTKDELENITRTMGFVKKGFNNRMTVQSLSNYYRKTMDNAVMDIASGAFSYNEVLKRTINEMTQSGIRTIDYSSGVHNRIDVAARRAALTGFRQVQGKINEQVANDLGTDSYEVTVHIGARPTHQVWEGKVYTYQQLVDICGLGSVTGLKGANCYHDYNAFIPGVSVRTYTDEQLDQIHEAENKKRLYSGKEYTTYEALQRQRELERHARKYREDVHLLELGGGSEDDINASKGHYRWIMSEYADFSKKMGLPMQKDRIYNDGLAVDMNGGKEPSPVLAISSDLRRDTDQFKRYRDLMGDEAPKTLEEFIQVKYTDSERYGKLKHIYRVANQYEFNAGEMPASKITELHDVAVEQKAKLNHDGRNGSNMGIMELDGKMYYANSRASAPSDSVTRSFKCNKGQLALLPDDRCFYTFPVDGFDRKVDSEAKLFEYAARIADDGKEHTIYMLSERHMCKSCRGVKLQFIIRYPNVKVNVVSHRADRSAKNKKKNPTFEIDVKRRYNENKKRLHV